VEARESIELPVDGSAGAAGRRLLVLRPQFDNIAQTKLACQNLVA